MEKEDYQAWEDGREGRVDAWRNFSSRKERTEKRKKIKFGVHAPQNVAEERRTEVKGRPMGIQFEYKK